MNTKINTPAKIERIVSFWILSKMALKMFVSSEISVNISKMCIVYHSTPMKLPASVADTNIRIDKKPD